MHAAPTTAVVGTGVTAPAKSRLAFIDNLRWVMIVLVVSMHAAVTYSHVGSWYFMEDPKPGPAVLVLFAGYQMFLQAFFMGLLFLIAGYFVPDAFDRKGFANFLRDRAVRLGVPSLIYMILIQPLTVYGLLRAFADDTLPPLTQAYIPYLASGRFLGGSGPMWFAVALLLFSLAYGIARLINQSLPRSRSEASLPNSLQIAGFALLIAICTFLVRTVQPMGTSVLNLQLCFFSQYILLFLVGIQARRRDWLLRIPYRLGVRWLAVALGVGGPAWLAIILAVLRTHSETQLSGGWTWQSAALSIWESFFCVGVCLGLIVIFRDKFNRQGRMGRWLSDNSFCVYVFHPPILIAVTLAMRNLEAPKLLKFFCASVFGITLSYLASSLLLRRVPLLKRVL